MIINFAINLNSIFENDSIKVNYSANSIRKCLK